MDALDISERRYHQVGTKPPLINCTLQTKEELGRKMSLLFLFQLEKHKAVKVKAVADAANKMYAKKIDKLNV